MVCGLGQHLVTSKAAVRIRFRAPQSLDGKPATDFNNVVGRQPEVVGDVNGVALHRGEERLFPCRQSLPVPAADDRLVADVIGDVLIFELAPMKSGAAE